MNRKLDEMDKFIAKKEEELQHKLEDKQTGRDQSYRRKDREDERGDGRRAGQARQAAAVGGEEVLHLGAGDSSAYSLVDIEGIIDKGVAVLKAIFTKPIQFVKNLIACRQSLGFKNFGKNFLTHLKDALFDG